jgi:predicted nucleotidyltransferase
VPGNNFTNRRISEMDQANAIIKARAYSKLVNAFINVERIILFGSYAKGTQRKNSDIDIAIVVKRMDKGFFDVEPVLWRLRREIDPLIEPLLIEEENDPSGFLDEIIKSGVVIYSKDRLPSIEFP